MGRIVLEERTDNSAYSFNHISNSQTPYPTSKQYVIFSHFQDIW